MILIVGGAYQGKRDYAMNGLNIPAEAVETCTTEHEPDWDKQCIANFEQWVLGQVQRGADAEQALQDLLPAMSGKVILWEDIQCGVVPIDSTQRAWRDANGRCMCRLAREASRVIRMCCGLALELKP